MKTLNRPMFRYGGPIKEGVMNGIREPKKHGGSMRAALVGNPVYPKTNGREHHALVFGAALPAIGAAALRYGRLSQYGQGLTGLSGGVASQSYHCLLYTSPSPRD